MDDIKKRVRLDNNNKLVVENDNAEITSEGTFSNIEGVYEIDGEDVEKLLVLINDKTILKPFISHIERFYIPRAQIITCNEELDKLWSNLSKKYDDLKEENNTLYNDYIELYKLYDELKKEHNELNAECYELRNKHMTMKGNFDDLIEKVKEYNKNRLFNKIKINELK